MFLVPLFRKGLGKRRRFNLMTDLYKVFTYPDISNA